MRALVLSAVVAGCSGVVATTEGEATRLGPGASLGPDASLVGDAPSDGRAKDNPAPDPPVPEPLCALGGPPAATAGEVLVHSDDFAGSAVDPLKWNVASGIRGPAGVLNSTSPANAVVAGGLLSIVSERNGADLMRPYVSGYMESLGKFARTYGKYEFRARFPYAAGVWFAMWGRSWAEPFPEIDIEVLNKGSVGHSQLYFVNHWAAPPLPAPERRTFAMLEDIDVSKFHVYTVNWRPGFLEWSVDGVAKMQADPRGIPDLPVFWIINAWVGDWAGSPTDATPFPVTFQVDYMKVYRVDGLVANPEIKILRPLQKYARTEVIEVAVANFDEACAHVAMYDGGRLVRTTSTVPARFPLSELAPGQHTISFVATDGVRRTESSMVTQVY